MSERIVEIGRTIVERATANVKAGKVHAAGLYTSPSGNVYGVEYHSDSEGKDQVIYFEESHSGNLIVHHPNPCPGFKKEIPNCWHLGLYGTLTGARTYEATVGNIDPMDLVFKEDVTPGTSGRFGILPTYVGPAMPVSSLEIEPEEKEVTPKTRTRKAKVEDKGIVAVILDPIKEMLEGYNIKGQLLDRVLAMREKNLSTLSTKERNMVPDPLDHVFYPTGPEILLGLMTMAKETWEPYLLTGAKGTGKSNLARLLCGFLGIPVVGINANHEMGQEVLLGSNTLEYFQTIDKSQEAKIRHAIFRSELDNALKDKIINSLSESKAHVVFQEGALLQAARKGYCLLIEEINVLPPDVQISMNMLLDKHRAIYVPGVGTEEPHERFRLIGTMNPGYMGTNELAPSFRDRFIKAEVEHMNDDAFAKLMLNFTADTDAVEALTRVYNGIKERVLGAGATLPEEVLSIRDLARVAEAQNEFGGKLKDWAKNIIVSPITDTRVKKSVQDIIELING